MKTHIKCFDASKVIHIKSKLQMLETYNYRLLWGIGAGAGTFIIERMSDNYTTLRWVGSEALEQYKELKRLYNISGGCFDDLCAKFDYTE